jgi:hypothetical protein
MPIQVVDLFEVIDVEQDRREPRFSDASSAKLDPVLEKRPAVE